jgi:hypothetical protein
MTDIPIGVGFLEWTIEAAQDATPIEVAADYHVVTDTWTAMTGRGPQWLSGVVSFTFADDGPGPGTISVTTPPHPDYPVPSDHQYVVGHGIYEAGGGDQTLLSVWVATNGFFFFREGGVPSTEDFGANFTVGSGDFMSFCFRFPITEPGPA